MREPPEADCRTVGCIRVLIFQRRGEFLAFERGELVDPGDQGGLSGRAGLDPLPAGVRNARGRLAQQERVGRRFLVDQAHQRFAESFELEGGGWGVGELQPGGGRNPVGDMAPPASRVFEHGIEGFRKWRFVCGEPHRHSRTQDTD
jgi:hypothetical protein